MTASNRFKVERIGRIYIAQRFNCKLLGHKSAFDAKNDNILFEIKTVTNTESNPKIHIATDSYNGKLRYDGTRWIAILAVVLVNKAGDVVEVRYGSIQQHCRFKSLMTEKQFTRSLRIFQS